MDPSGRTGIDQSSDSGSSRSTVRILAMPMPPIIQLMPSLKNLPHPELRRADL